MTIRRVLRIMPQATLMLVSAGLAVAAARFPREPGAWSGPSDAPFLFCGALALLAGIRMVAKLVSKPVEKGATAPAIERTSGFWILPVLTAGGLVLMPIAGFITSSSLLAAAVLWANGYRPVGRALAFGLILAFVLFVLFDRWMQVPLPKGWLG